MRVVAVDQVGALRRQVPPLRGPQLVALLVARLASLAVGYFVYVRMTTPTPTQVNTVAVTQGPITAGVNGTGSVIAESAAKANFRGVGRVSEVYVRVGDRVQRGQALAQLDVEDLQGSLQQAQAGQAQADAKLQTVLNGARPEDVAAAQAQLLQAQARLADMLTARPDDVAAAQASLDAAQAKLRGMENQGRPEDVAAAQAALDSARAKLQQTMNGALAADMAAARTAVDSARSTLASNQAKLEQVAAGATEAEMQAAVAGVSSADSTLQQAEAKLNALLNPSNADIIAAQVALDNAASAQQAAQAKLDQLMHPTDSDLAAAQAALLQAQSGVRSAQSKLQQARPGVSSPEVTAAGEDVTAAARNLQ